MHSLRYMRVCLGLATVACAVMMPGIVGAADISWQPKLQVGGGYDDNVRMAYKDSGEEIEASSLFQTQASGELAVAGEDAKSTLYGRYWHQSVPANDDFDASIKQVRWDFSQSTDRSQLTLDLDVQHDTTLTSEFENTGLSLRNKKDRHFFNGKFGYRWQLSELDSISADLSGEKVRYLNAENTELSDYDTRNLAASYSRSISLRANIGIQLAYSEFDIPEIGTPGNSAVVQPKTAYETDNIIAMMFGGYEFSEQDSLNFQAGFRKSEFYFERSYRDIVFNRTEEEGSGRVFSIDYTHRFNVSSLQLSASRDLRPSGSGVVVEEDSFSVGLFHGFSPKLSMNTSLSAKRQQEPLSKQELAIPSAAAEGREFAQLSVSTRVSISEQQALSLELNERWQRYERDTSDEAEGTAIFLRWYWYPPRKTL